MQLIMFSVLKGIYSMKLIGGLFDMMEARRRRENREAAMFLGCGCFGFLIIGIVMAIVVNVMNAVESGAVRDTYGTSYAEACQPTPSGNENQDNMPDTDSPRQVLLLVSDTQRRHEWHNDLPSQWQAEDEDEVVLVGCVEAEQITLETCEYERESSSTRGDGTFTVRVERIQYEATIVLINPDTGRRIDSLTITGDEPDDCPDDDEDVTVSRSEYGDEVEWDDFAEWIEEYVFD